MPDLMVSFILLAAAAILGFLILRAFSKRQRRSFLQHFRMPDAIVNRFLTKHPELTDSQKQRVAQGMNQYFQACLRAQGRFVSMPSQIVDDLWHEFILFTRNYELFCRKAFGRYLHHTPVEAMSGPTLATDGIRRTWFHACRIEGIDPKQPDRLPLLFALDAELGIANGFFYSLNCENTATSGIYSFCASSIGCGTGTSCGGDTTGIGDSNCGSSCSSGCGGGGD